MWVIRRFGEDIPDDAPGQFTGALVLFQDDEHLHAWFDVCAGLSVHIIYSSLLVSIRPLKAFGLLDQRIYFVQKYGEIEVARRVTVLCEQRGGFTAMLRAMVDNMQQAMP